MYTVITTCPESGSRNVGDKLIETRLKELLKAEKGDSEFLTIFREEPLDDRLAEINATRAALMPAFPVRDTPMYPGTYRLAQELDSIRVPMIPVGANWNAYPGDAETRRAVNYSQETTAFLQYVASQTPQVSCREYHLPRILARHGVPNTVMTGDPAMFRLDRLGQPMARPSSVENVVFSPPLSPYYADQAKAVMTLLAELFANARRTCAFHLADRSQGGGPRSENSAAMTPAVAEKNRRIREHAADLAFEVLDVAGRVEGLATYDACDLHVGYECHAHLCFLSARLPSVLIAEDARGVGFNYTLGVGGFRGFERARGSSAVRRKTHTSGYCTDPEERAVAPPRADLCEALEQYLVEEADSGFRRFLGLADRLDELYERAMRPFVRSLP